LAPLLEGRLGAPAAYLLPTYARRTANDHPLTHLATTTRALAAELDFDALAALARDAARFAYTAGPLWGLTPEHRPEVLVIARIANGGGRHTLDRFVGIPRYPWQIPSAIDALLRGAGMIVDQEVVTAFGEVVRADVMGLIFTRYLDRRDSQGGTAGEPEAGLACEPLACSGWQILRGHLSPRRPIQPSAPELFTWSSAFNNARDRWPGVAGFEQLACLTPPQQSDIANHFLGYGLEALAAESEYTAVRLAAKRLLELCDRGFVDLHVTSHPYGALQKMTGRDCYDAGPLLPEEHGLVYLASTDPDAASVDDPTDSRGTVLVPLQWIDAAIRREIVALVHLVRVASFARDASFGKLSGSAFGYSRELRASAEIPLFDVAVARADALASRFLDEALRYDTRIYGLRVQRDDYCRAIERRPHRVSQYPDPPSREDHPHLTS